MEPDADAVLLETEDGLTFEGINAEEALFLYEEIFVRKAYMQHGIQLQAGDVVLDVGANIGLFSLYCARTAPDCCVLACEPVPAMHGVLARNVAAHAGVVPLPLALADRPGRSEVAYFPDMPGESTRHVEEAQAQQRALGLAEPRSCVLVACQVETVSTLMQRFQMEEVDLLKIDAEGDELAVLRGVRELDWPRIRQVVAEVRDVDGRLDSCVQLLRQHGLEVHTEPQRTGEVEGYLMVVPPELGLHYVYAVRPAR